MGLVFKRNKIISAIDLNKLILAIEDKYPDDLCITILNHLFSTFNPSKSCANRFVWLVEEGHYLDVRHFWATTVVTTIGFSRTKPGLGFEVDLDVPQEVPYYPGDWK